MQGCMYIHCQMSDVEPAHSLRLRRDGRCNRRDRGCNRKDVIIGVKGRSPPIDAVVVAATGIKACDPVTVSKKYRLLALFMNVLPAN